MIDLSPVKTRWNALAQREKTLVAAAAAMVGLALLWWIAVGPALSTLRSAEEQHRDLDNQLQRMLGLRAQALALHAQPRQNRDEAVRAPDASVQQRLGSASRMQVAGDRVTVTLSAVPPDALAMWLTQARVNARAIPAEARLTRNPAGLWEGSVAMNLPPR